MLRALSGSCREVFPWQIGENGGVAFTGNERVKHCSARHPEDVRCDGVEFDRGVFENLLCALLLSDVCLDQTFAVTGQITKLTNLCWWNERRTKQAMFEEFGQPCRIGMIGLAAV